jgi:hypothetical protein
MDEFVKNVYSMYTMITEEDTTKFILNIKIVEKQYLLYYLYRILCKYQTSLSNEKTKNNIQDVFNMLNIPLYYKLCYPLAGRIPNDEQILNICILKIIEIFNTNAEIYASYPSYGSHINMMEFLSNKSLKQIISDLIDLQKLVPNISSRYIRPIDREYTFINSKNNNIKKLLKNINLNTNTNTSANILNNPNTNASYASNVSSNASTNASYASTNVSSNVSTNVSSNVSPTGSNASTNISPTGSNASTNISPTGSNASTNISPNVSTNVSSNIGTNASTNASTNSSTNASTNVSSNIGTNAGNASANKKNTLSI